MNYDHSHYEERSFPSDWGVPQDCRGRIFVGGLSPENAEAYYLLDFDRRRICHWSITVDGYAREMAGYMQARMAAASLPYGIRHFLELTPNFLQPHEALELADGTIVVAMHNAGYMRILRTGESTAGAFPDGGRFAPVMLSATNSLSRDGGRLVYARWSLDDRIALYSGERQTIDVEIREVSSDQRTERLLGRMEALDSVHEVKLDPSERRVLLTEFCLTAREPPPPNRAGVFDDAQSWQGYDRGGLADSRLYLVDLIDGRSASIVPSTKTPGHIELSHRRPDIVYLSSHNLSKANGRVILHGPGALTEVRVGAGRLDVAAQYTRPDFFRITSHKVFRRHDAVWVVATVYPNRIFLFDDATGRLQREVVLFESDVPSPDALHFSVLGHRIPIWLETSDNGRYVILTSNHHVYLYDVDCGEVREYQGYPFAGPFIGTAHITNLNDFRPRPGGD